MLSCPDISEVQGTCTICSLFCLHYNDDIICPLLKGKGYQSTLSGKMVNQISSKTYEIEALP